MFVSCLLYIIVVSLLSVCCWGVVGLLFVSCLLYIIVVCELFVVGLLLVCCL